MKTTLEKILSKFKNPENLYEAMSLKDKNNDIRIFKINKHYTFIQESEKYENSNVATNFTSHPNLKIYNSKENSELITLTTSFKPNMQGENKANYLTPPHVIDKNSSEISILDGKTTVKANKFKQAAHSFFIKNKDTHLLYSENEMLYKSDNSFTVKEYSNEYDLKLSKNIQFLEKFEKENEEYLSTEQGKEDYIILKNYIFFIYGGDN
jgi:hypothetical protein